MIPVCVRLLNELKQLPISIHRSLPSTDIHFKHTMNFVDISDKHKSWPAFDLVFFRNGFGCIDIDFEKDHFVFVLVSTPLLDLKSFSFTKNTKSIGRMTSQSFLELRTCVYFLANISMTYVQLLFIRFIAQFLHSSLTWRGIMPSRSTLITPPHMYWSIAQTPNNVGRNLSRARLC